MSSWRGAYPSPHHTDISWLRGLSGDSYHTPVKVLHTPPPPSSTPGHLTYKRVNLPLPMQPSSSLRNVTELYTKNMYLFMAQ